MMNVDTVTGQALRSYHAALAARYPDAVIVFLLPDGTVQAVGTSAHVCAKRGGGTVVRLRQRGDAWDLLALPRGVYETTVRPALFREQWELCEVLPLHVQQGWGCWRRGWRAVGRQRCPWCPTKLDQRDALLRHIALRHPWQAIDAGLRACEYAEAVPA